MASPFRLLLRGGSASATLFCGATEGEGERMRLFTADMILVHNEELLRGERLIHAQEGC